MYSEAKMTYKSQNNFGETSERKNAYSLVEMLVTLIVVNIIIVMMANILVTSFKISILAQERSMAREELTNTVNLIRRDLRNASIIVELIDSGGDDTSIYKGISLHTDLEYIKWVTCGDDNTQICRYIIGADGTSETPNYISTPKLKITKFEITDMQDAGLSGNDRQATISLLITADHSREELNIKNLYRQVNISTRNFPL